ncbi:DNA polymerase III subunit gamma/tau [Adhaeribacter radiodurans]|uniref:DNA polymerase III subunit gamma/tau n=1 Tax=Adhaeribacter radiodurans TaxID=2745197 RepID=A0A7L7L4L3_9BACT|nr:DNA polymerase III subunit gamma/tau [Adhaeribacter radiodurans]QMU27736.1 DNA polymerase III subunit gamma/tau [Adhaeribacter radiodurans]
MENFVVSARKYRPATFDSVVGQHHITTTLKNAINSNHLAQAFLFCGPRGVGKTTCARILAKTINCQNITPTTEACNVCESCRSFNNNASFNVHELDAASNNSVEDIRNLVEQVRYAPQTGKYKIYIIDEVHMLSNSAFNAFLKTLEEPPSYAIFILATTERHKIIPTILSRCQIFDFNRIRIEDMVKHLNNIAAKEEITAEDDALHLIAQKADGALRDALSIFDQMVTFSGNKITYKATVDNLHILDYDYYFKLTDYFLANNLSGTLLLFDEILKNGFDAHNFVLGIGEHFRSLLVCRDPVTVQLLEVSDNIKTKYAQQAQKASLSLLLSGLNIVAACDQNFKNSKNQRLHVELCLMKLVHLPSAVTFAKDFSSNGDVKKKTSLESDVKVNTLSEAPGVTSMPDTNGQKASTTSITSTANGASVVPVAMPINDSNGSVVAEPMSVTSPTAINKLPPVPTVPLPAPNVPEDQYTEQQFIRPAAPLPPAKKIVKLPSLKDIKAQVQSPVVNQEAAVLEAEPESLNQGSIQPVNQFEFEMVWKQLTEQKKAEGKMAEYMILNRPVQLTSTNEIRLEVENHVQIEQFNSIRAEFLAALRNRLRNNRLNVKIEVKTQVEGVKLYTSIDKYNYLAERYPILPEIKKRLGLDTSF